MCAQQFDKALDLTQRRPQFVRNGIAERLQFLVGRLQFGGAHGNPVFQFLIQPADFFFGLPALEPGLRFAQGAVQGRGEGGQSVLENEVRSPALERLGGHFLSQRSGDKNERHFRTLALRDRQRGKSIKRAQPVVGQNHVRVKARQFLDERTLGIDNFEGEFKAGFAQHLLRKVGVGGFVFDHQNSQLPFNKPEPSH